MFCSSCGTALSKGVPRCPGCRKWTRRSRALTVVLLLIALTAVTVAGTSYGMRAYRMQEIKARLAEAVGRDSGYTETILKAESEASGMTYAELFQLCDKSIEDRTQLIVGLRGLYPE